MYRNFDGKFEEAKHPRGQPGNPGQFAPKGGGGSGGPSEAKGKGAPKQGKAEGGKGQPKEKIAPRQKQIEGAVELTSFLRTVSSHHKGIPSVYQFVLRHGQPYTANTKTYAGPRGTMHQCFKNAALEALSNPDRTYVEGYVVVHGIPIEHAWTVDKTGQIYDPTIDPGIEVSGYYGVPFDTGYLQQSLLRNKVYGLLGHKSRKTLEPLLEGKGGAFQAEVDPDSLSPSAIADRVSYADAVVRSIPPTDKIDTPERQALRKEIGDKFYNEGIENRTHNREATIILGLPGAGKSVFKKPTD